MGKDTVELRNKARRVKDLTLARAIFVLENPDKVEAEVYKDTYLTALKNSIPRSQEITGEDGQSLVITIAKPIADKNGIDYSTNTDSTGSPQV